MKQIIFFCCYLVSLIYLPLQSSSQSITSLVPNAGFSGQSIDIVIIAENSNFIAGQTTVQVGNGIQVKKVIVQNAFTLLATLEIAANTTAGYRNITIITGTETLIKNEAFEVFVPGGAVKVSLELVPLESISVGDLDPTLKSNGPAIFFVNIYNNAVKKKIKAELTISSGKFGKIGVASVKDVPLEPNAYVRIGNKDFPNFDITPKGSEFQKAALVNGGFPPDNYTYQIILKDDLGNIIADDINESVISNKKYPPELIAPGNNFQQATAAEVFLKTPYFQWFGQSDRFDFYLYKRLPGQTAEEAVRNIPVFKATDLQNSNLVYPNYAEPLIDGQEYVWQVVGKYQNSSGFGHLLSEVFKFLFKKIPTPSENPEPPPPLKSNIGSANNANGIQIIPKDITLMAGQKIAFQALFNNKPLSNIQWKLSSPFGQIDQQGNYTAPNKAGIVAVIIQYKGNTEYATITVKNNVSNNGVPFNLEELMFDQMMRKIFGIKP